MRIAYVNTYYQAGHTGGGHVHMEQFVANAAALGHEIWCYPRHGYSQAHTIPISRLHHIRTMRYMDVLYIRMEGKFPEICTWSLPPRRTLYGFPVVVWEFNTTPAAELLRGRSEDEVGKTIQSFRRYSPGCDLAVCMTHSLAEYVQHDLGIKRVLIIPNGSDPELFRPDAPIAKRIVPFRDKFNVVWIGSPKEVWHDFRMLGEAAQIVWKTDQNIAFHVIGANFAGSMADMPPNLYYWGAEYYEKLPNWLAGMDVGLSLYHPGPADHATPLKVFDYMASGLAVVSTPQPFMAGLFDRLGEPGLLVSSGDAACLAKILLDLASDRERVCRLGLAGRQLVIDQYNWRKSVQDTMNELEAILGKRKNNQ